VTTCTLEETITSEAAAPALERMYCRAARSGDSARLDTRRPASYDHPKWRETATYVPDPARCERPDGRWSNSSVPDCGCMLWVVHSILADRIRGGKKSFCCVTTRCRNLCTLTTLGRGFGALAAHALSLGVPCLDLGCLAVFGLSPRRLPAADLTAAFRVLTVALIPSPGQVPTPAPFAQAVPRARSPRSSPTAVLPLNLIAAQGRHISRGRSLGRVCHHSPRALSKRAQVRSSPV
jgi:hypothetical protein